MYHSELFRDENSHWYKAQFHKSKLKPRYVHSNQIKRHCRQVFVCHRKDQLGQNSQKICTTNSALLAVGIRFSRRRSSLNNAEATSRQNRSADTSVGYSSGPKLNYFFAKIKLLTFGQKEASHNYACFEKRSQRSLLGPWRKYKSSHREWREYLLVIVWWYAELCKVV